MEAIGKVCNEKELRLDCVARGMEDRLSFSIRSPRRAEAGDGDGDTGTTEKSWCIKFIDSCLFLPSSLENLVKLNPRDKFYAVKEVFGEEDARMLLRKGVFPYDYFDSTSKLDEENLPPIQSFYSRLTNEHISTADYEFALQVWEHFDMKTFRDYHNLHLMLDVLLLADVFTEFRQVSLINYTLDPANYITLPSLAWDACLKITDVKLDSIYDPDMYTFFEQGKRGGVAVISHRAATANNHHLPNTYNSEEPSTHIIYVDANNLYGWAMVRYLPTGGFCWMTQEDICTVDWEGHPDDSNIGYTLEVDLDYPEEIHDIHNSNPLAPENLLISSDMLSPYAHDLKEQLGLDGSNIKKLAPNLYPKKNYVLHYQNLKLYLRLGMKLTKVHKVIKYRQEPWMKHYIELNTRLRSQANNDFEKDFFKLMNNAVFGNSIENVRKYIELKLVTKEEQFIKLAANPRYKRSSIFDDELLGVAMKKKTMCFDKPIYVGVSVLDMSKILMYQYHYDYMIPSYSDKATLLFTDMDSLAYQVETKNIYDDMKTQMDLFDTSEYPRVHELYSLHNKKVLGKFKDKTKGTPIQSFIGLRAKMYSFECDGESKKRAKGVKKNVVRKEISHEDYMLALNDRQKFRHSMSMFRSMQHQIYSITQQKTSLSPYDDKRYILEDGISTLAYGHYRIPSDPLDDLINAIDNYLCE